ncbi:hypothetical protein N7468_009073 [Penicillium chermesinum]|uniref:Uncharacterized protein n=1 Tax=Penicillium chermesinum TaxID=63820 RepID=A0A9W9NH39_9EURO|nr:uncharacterized protein N7468_009073 [Penicillium chermesinum]KAJ5219869.1 hypothetical protein N7468_009073 [Penicillium chermesinum]KAJ6157327.1 hypothetical protein N7470_004919 [Penicillium chermesinum]
MASNKDMRRADLVIPYIEPPKSASDGDMSSTRFSSPPVVFRFKQNHCGTLCHSISMTDTTNKSRQMFTRNRMIGWVSFVFSLQSWLAESPEQKKNAATPAYMSVFMSLMALLVTYFPLFMPPQAKAAPGANVPSA